MFNTSLNVEVATIKQCGTGTNVFHLGLVIMTNENIILPMTNSKNKIGFDDKNAIGNLVENIYTRV